MKLAIPRRRDREAVARDIVVIGGSAGAIEAIIRIVRELPRDPEAAIAVVVHRHPGFVSSLSQLLSRRSNIAVVEPSGGERFVPGVVYLAPQDLHMTIRDDRIVLDRGPKQHHTRPAIDPLFRSVAAAYGGRVIGVLLSGNLDDGVGGLLEIKARGGISLVQDPREAPYPSMPANALSGDHVDLVFRIEALWTLVRPLIHGEAVQDLLVAQEIIQRRSGAEPPFWEASATSSRWRATSSPTRRGE